MGDIWPKIFERTISEYKSIIWKITLANVIRQLFSVHDLTEYVYELNYI